MFLNFVFSSSEEPVQWMAGTLVMRIQANVLLEWPGPLGLWPGFCDQDVDLVMFPQEIVDGPNVFFFFVFFNEKCICILFLIYACGNNQTQEEIA